MESEKDQGKQIVPLFPGLHISDGDKGRPPPRNKMALYEDYNVNPQGPELRPVSRPLSLPMGNGSSNFFSQPSSSHVSLEKMFVT